jgi:hypothetical protein
MQSTKQVHPCILYVPSHTVPFLLILLVTINLIKSPGLLLSDPHTDQLEPGLLIGLGFKNGLGFYSRLYGSFNLELFIYKLRR